MKKIILPLFFARPNRKSTNEGRGCKYFTLKNGKSIGCGRLSIPNANMYLFYKVVATSIKVLLVFLIFFEHMMFNGAKKYPKQFDQTMEFNGGANNAYTTENVTVYTDWFPASAAAVIFDLEADRISSLSIDPSIVESERGVVLVNVVQVLKISLATVVAIHAGNCFSRTSLPLAGDGL
jgi:hypothetical protein